MTSKERRERQLLFIPDEDDWARMKRARKLLHRLNSMDPSDFDAIRKTVNELFGKSDETTFLNPPFYCDYACSIGSDPGFYYRGTLQQGSFQCI